MKTQSQSPIVFPGKFAQEASHPRGSIPRKSGWERVWYISIYLALVCNTMVSQLIPVMAIPISFDSNVSNSKDKIIPVTKLKNVQNQTTDLRNEIRNELPEPDRLQVEVNIVKDNPAHIFNAAFSVGSMIVPEPATLIFLGTGLTGWMIWRWRQYKA